MPEVSERLKPPAIRAPARETIPRGASWAAWGLSSRAASAGERLSELIAEITVATAITVANWA